MRTFGAAGVGIGEFLRSCSDTEASAVPAGGLVLQRGFINMLSLFEESCARVIRYCFDSAGF